MLLLSRGDLERLLAPADVIKAVASAFREYAAGRAQVLPRAVMPMGRDGIFLSMVSALPRRRALGTKLVTVMPGNRRRHLPTIHASYLLTDPQSGAPLAMMEAAFLTAIRTGATSALAARYLARSGARSVTCFGAGVQAAFQLRCLQVVLDIEQVRVIGRSRPRAQEFAARMSQRLGVPVLAVPARPIERRIAVRDADVIICATTSGTPVFSGLDLRAGTHVDAVGAFRPTTREVDTHTVKRARVVVDTYAGAWEEAGDLLIPLEARAITRGHVKAELSELVARTKRGRTSPEEITLFKSVGFAPEDAATARLAYDRARAARVGKEVCL